MSESIELNRRSFAKATGGTIASLAGLSGAGSVLEGESDPSFSNEHGDFHILYGEHTQGSEPYDPSELPDGMDGFFIENTSDYTENSFGHIDYFQKSEQYGDLIDEMAQEDTSVYMTDVNLSTDGRLAETGLIAGEAGLGAGLAAKAGMADDFGKKEAGMTGLAGWLLQPLASYTSLLSNPESERAQDFADSSKEMHPEKFRITRDFRNNVVAYKQLELMERNEEDSCYGSVWGTLHSGFEESLAKEKERLLDNIESSKPVWEPFIGNEETIYKAVEFDQHNGQWYAEDVHEFPELREIVE